MNDTLRPKTGQAALECLLLVGLATLLRVWFLPKTDLGFDEGFSLYISLLQPSEIVRLLCQGDNPPLWELLLHGWTRLFGISEISIRSLSLLFSVLTVIPIYHLGERYLHRFVGMAAALFYCCSTFSIFLAHDARVYSLLAFAAALSAWLFASAISDPKPYKFILLTLANLMLLYGHYLSIWIIVMEFAIVLVFKPIRTRILKPYLLHIAALLVLFAPMYPVLINRFMASGMHGTWIEKSTGLEDLYNMFLRMCNVPVVTVLALILMIVALVRWGILSFKEKKPFTMSTVMTLLWVVPLLVSFALSFFTGFMLDRYFYFLYPIFYLSLACCGVQLFRHRRGKYAIFMIMVIAMALSCSPDSSTKRFSGWHPDIKPMVSQLVEAKEERQALVIVPEYFEKQFVYYLDERHALFQTQGRPSDYYAFQDCMKEQGYYYDNNYLEADLSQYGEVVFPYHKTRPIEGLGNYLEAQGFRLTETVDAHPYAVCRYSAPSLP